MEEKFIKKATNFNYQVFHNITSYNTLFVHITGEAIVNIITNLTKVMINIRHFHFTSTATVYPPMLFAF